MDRNDRPLVPEWLKIAGSVTAGANAAPQFASSPHSDVPSLARPKNKNDFDSQRKPFFDRTSSSISHRGSSCGSLKHAYTNFGRSYRDKDRDREKDGWNLAERLDGNGSEYLGKTSNRSDNSFRHSHSTVTRKQSDTYTRRDSKNSSDSYYCNGNGIFHDVTIHDIPKRVFEKDFPTLGAEIASDIQRNSSPCLNMAVQSLSIGNTSIIAGEGWTSALAEVPTIVRSSSDTCTSPAAKCVLDTVSGTPIAVAGMNMAGALQAPARIRTPPQLSVETHRLEELAIKQSKLLIPVTPSMPKGSVLNSSDKSKPKSLSRSSEMNLIFKNVNQPIPSSNHVRCEAPKTSPGNLLILKPGWENGLAPTKEYTGPTNNGNVKVVNNQHPPASVVSSISLKTLSNSKLSTGERRLSTMNLISELNVEKRPSLAQTQSRNEFFNLLKNKTDVASENTQKTSVTAKLAVVASHTKDESGESSDDVGSIGPSTPHATDNDCKVVTFKCTFSVEQEYAFLHWLCWKEPSDEDEVISIEEDEIITFWKEHPELKRKKVDSDTSVERVSTELISLNSESRD